LNTLSGAGFSLLVITLFLGAENYIQAPSELVDTAGPSKSSATSVGVATPVGAARHFYIYNECYKPITTTAECVPIGETQSKTFEERVEPGSQKLFMHLG